jgi:hypothetical protein
MGRPLDYLLFVADYGEWQCGINGEWGPSSADLSRCVSRWTHQLQRDLSTVQTNFDALNMARAIQRKTHIEEMIYGGDLLTVTSILKSTIEKFVDDTRPKLIGDGIAMSQV